MGLHISVYRNAEWADGTDCTNGGLSSKYTSLCVVNAEGPFEPSAQSPAVLLDNHYKNSVRLIPAEKVGGVWKPIKGHWQMGGNYGATSDSRFGELIERLGGVRFYGAVAIHDRKEW
jgi:hypothetical protein